MTTDDRRPRPTFGVALERAIYDLRWLALATALGAAVLAVLGTSAILGRESSWTESALLGVGTLAFMGLLLISLTSRTYFALFKRQFRNDQRFSRPLFWVFVETEYGRRFGPVPLFLGAFLPAAPSWYVVWKVCVEQPLAWSVGIGIAGGLFTCGVIVLIHALATLEQWYDQT